MVDWFCLLPSEERVVSSKDGGRQQLSLTCISAQYECLLGVRTRHVTCSLCLFIACKHELNTLFQGPSYTPLPGPRGRHRGDGTLCGQRHCSGITHAHRTLPSQTKMATTTSHQSRYVLIGIGVVVIRGGTTLSGAHLTTVSQDILHCDVLKFVIRLLIIFLINQSSKNYFKPPRWKYKYLTDYIATQGKLSKYLIVTE